jgi:hypothetical protein
MTMTVQESIEWDMIRYGVTRQMALQFLIYDAFLLGHTFYSGDGHPIPKSSYLPHKGAPVDTQS